MDTRPLLVDLFCGAGVAADGFYAAGFDIVGVDKYYQPRFPKDQSCGWYFEQMDAFRFLQLYSTHYKGRLIAAFCASPPCQDYSALRFRGDIVYPRLIPQLRVELQDRNIPYVIENVEIAPLIDPILLCGTMFPGLRVIRHRLFESNVELTQPAHISRLEHPAVYSTKPGRPNSNLDPWQSFVSVTGGGNCSVECAHDAMGVKRRFAKKELNQGYPPAYSEFIGTQLLAALGY